LDNEGKCVVFVAGAGAEGCCCPAILLAAAVARVILSMLKEVNW
jgi:threonine dehydrogenase-like Zn-dependent dehydrogenase